MIQMNVRFIVLIWVLHALIGMSSRQKPSLKFTRIQSELFVAND